MYMEKKQSDSRRVQETKQKLQTALLELLQEKNIEQITVMEITERAQINRTSFYRYYLDVYDLYEQIIDALVEKLQQAIPRVLLKMLHQTPFSYQEVMMQFWQENQTLMTKCLQDNRLIQKLKTRNKAWFKEILDIDETDTALDFILEFYVAGQVGLVSYWMQNPEALSEDEFFALMHSLIMRGPLTVLNERIPLEILAEAYTVVEDTDKE